MDLLGPKDRGFTGVCPVGFQNHAGQSYWAVSQYSSLQAGALTEVTMSQLHYCILGVALASGLVFQLIDPFLMADG